MENAKFTKGKWERVGSIVYINENSKTIYPYYECGGFGIEKEANALLISKAPEMLEMLQNILEQIKDGRTYVTKEEIEQLIKQATEIDEPKNGDSITNNFY
jgi:hypothetical protein